ncbi:hypothetical protein GCM10012289_28890 [Nonomuraea cavernae]|uniref:Uncharacterized protein n=1 Tax=Nonomuraea cavernae TaxID=2045107 RepID=A0A917YXG9_9ACTN|nr:hypothetical protein GCM10012289_28890 [Nonomuraea cavernae]
MSAFIPSAAFFDELQDEDGLHDRGGAVRAAVQPGRDLQGLQGGNGAFTAGADARVCAVDRVLVA